MKRLPFFFLVLTHCYFAVALPSQLQAVNLIDSKKININFRDNSKKGTVVIFMSAKCPCSDSHVPVVKKLSANFKNFEFVIIHSNADETKKDAYNYFKKAALNLNVIEDLHSKIADDFKAFKTPHAFVVNPRGQIVYQGGVTNSSHAASADKHFLEDALKDLNANKSVQLAEGRTLGCVIMRESDLQ